MIEYNNINPYEFSNFYTVYALPYCILCFLNGFFIDRYFGVKLGLILFVSTAVFGQAIFITGAIMNQVNVILIGKLISGVGYEASFTVLNSYAVLWFKDKELNTVIALLMSIGTVGSLILNQRVEPHYEYYEDLFPEQHDLTFKIIQWGSVILLPVICAISVAVSNPDNYDYLPIERNFGSNIERKENVKITDFLHFPLSFWLLIIYGSVSTACCYSFMSQAQEFFKWKYNASDNIAYSYSSFIHFFGAGLSVFVGYLIDQKGRNISYVLFSCMTGIIGFIILSFTYLSPFIGMLFIGVSIATIYASNWGLFPYMIPDHQIATAFGIAQAGMNLATSLGPVAAGYVANRYGYDIMHSFLLASFVVTAPALLWCWIIDKKGTGILNMTGTERKQYLSKIENYNVDITERILR